MSEPQNNPTEPIEPTKPTEPPVEPNPEPTVKDTHGQPGINLEKHNKQMAEKDAKIADLEARLEEAAKNEQTRAELRSEIDGIKAGLADERQTFELEKAGCIDIESAKAVIDNYKGDIDGLKQAKPWLFEKQAKGSTGLKPTGAPTDNFDANLDKAFGLI